MPARVDRPVEALKHFGIGAWPDRRAGTGVRSASAQILRCYDQYKERRMHAADLPRTLNIWQNPKTN
jgi:hypothetical protein